MQLQSRCSRAFRHSCRTPEEVYLLPPPPLASAMDGPWTAHGRARESPLRPLECSLLALGLVLAGSWAFLSLVFAENRCPRAPKSDFRRSWLDFDLILSQIGYLPPSILLILFMLFRPSASTRSKNTRPAKNLKKNCHVLQKSRFSVWAHASKIDRKSLRTRLSSEMRHRAPSKNNVFEFPSATMTSEVPLGCLGRLPGPLLDPLGPQSRPLGQLLGPFWAPQHAQKIARP